MILTIIQARLGSTRLPGKILLPIAGKPILQHVIDAAPEPKKIAMTLADSAHIPYTSDVLFYNLDPDDVLSRFYYTWEDHHPEADWILRLTADCPMLTREVVDRFIEMANWFDISRYEYPYTIFTNR